METAFNFCPITKRYLIKHDIQNSFNDATKHCYNVDPNFYECFWMSRVKSKLFHVWMWWIAMHTIHQIKYVYHTVYLSIVKVLVYRIDTPLIDKKYLHHISLWWNKNGMFAPMSNETGNCPHDWILTELDRDLFDIKKLGYFTSGFYYNDTSILQPG